MSPTSVSDDEKTGPDGQARLYAVIARDARTAVVFRRGPSKAVLLLKWDLKTDTLTPGQWFKGRIYERRCDLSPDGELLVYFAARHHGPLGTWTAVSRPPYLTALALWPKGDAWGGGGLFDSSRDLRINHRSSLFAVGTAELADGYTLPKGFRVRPLGAYSGRGEDEPILGMRLERDGWRELEAGEVSDYSSKARFRWTWTTPQVMEKALDGRGKAHLRVALHGIGEANGPWYSQSAQVNEGGLSVDLGAVDWADVDHTGDVLFARDGCLFRLRRGALDGEAVQVADLRGLRFMPRAAPGFATGWPKSARRI